MLFNKDGTIKVMERDEIFQALDLMLDLYGVAKRRGNDRVAWANYYEQLDVIKREVASWNIMKDRERYERAEGVSGHGDRAV